MRKMSVFLGIFFLCLMGCQGNQKDDLGRYIESVKQRPSRMIDPLPKFVQTKQYLYSSQNLRSPFFEKKAVSTDAPDTKRKKEPLEAFPLDALKMVGSLTKENKTWALISTPDGTILKATIGNFMGQNYGKVIKIKRDSIELEEMVLEGDVWEKKSASLVLSTMESSGSK